MTGEAVVSLGYSCGNPGHIGMLVQCPRKHPDCNCRECMGCLLEAKYEGEYHRETCGYSIVEHFSDGATKDHFNAPLNSEVYKGLPEINKNLYFKIIGVVAEVMKFRKIKELLALPEGELKKEDKKV